MTLEQKLIAQWRILYSITRREEEEECHLTPIKLGKAPVKFDICWDRNLFDGRGLK